MAIDNACNRDEGEAKGQDETGIDEFQGVHGHQAAEKLRDSNPKQHRPCLQWQITLHGAEITWNDDHRRQKDEAKEDQHRSEQEHIALQKKFEIDQRVGLSEPANHAHQQQE